MKKALLLLIAVVLLTGTLWLKVSAAGADSLKVTVYSEFFTKVPAGNHVPARIIADSQFQNLDCAATVHAGYIACQFPHEYAGQQLDIEFTMNQIMYAYTVKVPEN